MCVSGSESEHLRAQSASPATKSALRGSVLCLPRNLRFEVHQVLRLPRNLHFEVHKRCACHEICTSRFTKCCACHEICTSRFTKYCACHGICTSRFTKFCACHEICTSRFTKCCACHEICKRATSSRSHDSLHLSRNSELVEDHHHVQSAALATKSAFPSKAAPIPCTCHEKSTLDHQNTRFPLHPPRKVTTMSENAHGTTTRAQSLEAPAAPTRFREPAQSKMHVDDFERHECTVNSSELAGHARAAQRSKHSFLTTTVP